VNQTHIIGHLLDLSVKGVVAYSFSHEPWVKTNQKNAMQQGGECGVC
jgi:hypothetical protein